MRTVDAIIVGQGFAGTALAWSLAKRGRSFVVIDSGDLNTSSKIAAGLVTPLTGKRAVKSWAWDEAWETAQRFYAEIENRTKSQFWNILPSLRLYESDEERQYLHSRLSHFSSEWVEAYEPSEGKMRVASYIDDSLGGFVMKTAARLEAPLYLNASRNEFLRLNSYHEQTLDLMLDLEVETEFIQIQKTDIQARRIVFCQGYTSQANPWFSDLELVPAQGDIITLKIPSLRVLQTLHRGVWLTAASYGSDNSDHSNYLVGSTYRWHPLDGVPSLACREEILMKLTRWMKFPFEVIDHQAAVRPTSFDQKPLLGQSSIDPRFWVFNGLGAKGALLAPWCAQQLVETLFDESPLVDSIRWDRRRL